MHPQARRWQQPVSSGQKLSAGGFLSLSRHWQAGASVFPVSGGNDTQVRENQTWPDKESTFKCINCLIALRISSTIITQITQEDTENPLDRGSLTSFLSSLACPLTLHVPLHADSFGVFFLPRSMATMTAVWFLGTGAVTTRVAWTQETGTAAWRSLSSGRDLASGPSDTASAGSSRGSSTQVFHVWGAFAGWLASSGLPWGATRTAPRVLRLPLTCSAAVLWDSFPSDHQLQLGSWHRPKPQRGRVLRRHGTALGQRQWQRMVSVWAFRASHLSGFPPALPSPVSHPQTGVGRQITCPHMVRNGNGITSWAFG